MRLHPAPREGPDRDAASSPHPPLSDHCRIAGVPSPHGRHDASANGCGHAAVRSQRRARAGSPFRRATAPAGARARRKASRQSSRSPRSRSFACAPLACASQSRAALPASSRSNEDAAAPLTCQLTVLPMPATAGHRRHSARASLQLREQHRHTPAQPPAPSGRPLADTPQPEPEPAAARCPGRGMRARHVPPVLPSSACHGIVITS
jgi:hypothetical protein